MYHYISMISRQMIVAVRVWVISRTEQSFRFSFRGWCLPSQRHKACLTLSRSVRLLKSKQPVCCMQ